MTSQTKPARTAEEALSSPETFDNALTLLRDAQAANRAQISVDEGGEVSMDLRRAPELTDTPEIRRALRTEVTALLEAASSAKPDVALEHVVPDSVLSAKGV